MHALRLPLLWVLLVAWVVRAQDRQPTGVVLHAAATCKALKVSTRADELSGFVSDSRGRRVRNVHLTLTPLRVRDGGVVLPGDMAEAYRGGEDGTFALFNGLSSSAGERVQVAVEAEGHRPEHFAYSSGATGCVEVILAPVADAGSG